jgi:hypothetical protein
MTPKEKAKELMLEYVIYVRYYDDYEHIDDRTKIKAQQCALIAVDEIILSRKDDSQFDDTLWAGGSDMYTMHPMYLKYWQEVKKEIEAL